MGVPRVYCSCTVCSEARSTGINERLRSSVMLQTSAGQLLLDCGPDWVEQMERLQVKEISDVLLTHAHHDHIGGLPEWADACRWTSKKGNLYAPEEVFDIVKKMYPWLERNLNFYAAADRLSFGGWSIYPWRVNHGKNGYSYAYRFEKNGFSMVYCPDSIGLPEDQKRPLYGLDVLVLGTNFYKEEAEYGSRSVYDMVEALQLIDEVRPRRIYFTHMSHDIDLRRSYGLPEHVEPAVFGLSVPLI